MYQCLMILKGPHEHSVGALATFIRAQMSALRRVAEFPEQSFAKGLCVLASEFGQLSAGRARAEAI